MDRRGEQKPLRSQLGSYQSVAKTVAMETVTRGRFSDVFWKLKSARLLCGISENIKQLSPHV